MSSIISSGFIVPLYFCLIPPGTVTNTSMVIPPPRLPTNDGINGNIWGGAIQSVDAAIIWKVGFVTGGGVCDSDWTTTL